MTNSWARGLHFHNEEDIMKFENHKESDYNLNLDLLTILY